MQKTIFTIFWVCHRWQFLCTDALLCVSDLFHFATAVGSPLIVLRWHPYFHTISIIFHITCNSPPSGLFRFAPHTLPIFSPRCILKSPPRPLGTPPEEGIFLKYSIDIRNLLILQLSFSLLNLQQLYTKPTASETIPSFGGVPIYGGVVNDTYLTFHFKIFFLIDLLPQNELIPIHSDNLYSIIYGIFVVC